jgi:transcriptional regulator with XRE-family HTH domain
MTQLELAERMGITVQQINKYVLNRQIMSLKVAKNIASILGCRIDDLYEWEKVGM